MSREKITIRGPKQRWFNHDVFFHQKRLLKTARNVWDHRNAIRKASWLLQAKRILQSYSNTSFLETSAACLV
jgi:hypothetical protein